MAITSYSQRRIQQDITVTVVSSLGGTIYYHWYIDGSYIGMTTIPSKSFRIDPSDQARIVCQDTNSATYDPIANAPTDYASRKSIYWIRSLATDVNYYRIDQRKSAGAWTEIGRVYHSEAKWDYSFLTKRLDDLTTYEFRIMPVDKAGNDGNSLDFAIETIVRRPNAPNFSATFVPATTFVTFAAV
jgi:hypothetical protein